MKNLWAPWRMSYILGKEGKKEGCIFDFDGDIKYDKDSLLLFRGNHCEVLLNRFPYANGHLLVAPVRHVASLSDLSAEESLTLMQVLAESIKIVEQHFKTDGLNVGLNLGKEAGAGLADHLHFHVVPRWQGDHNFIAVCADIRTIPQHIEKTFEDLFMKFQTLDRIDGR